MASLSAPCRRGIYRDGAGVHKNVLWQTWRIDNMKNPNLSLSNPEPHFDKPDPEMETELARRMAITCVHAAGRILVDATCYAPFEYRQAYTAIVGGLNTLEEHLIALAPKSMKT